MSSPTDREDQPVGNSWLRRTDVTGKHDAYPPDLAALSLYAVFGAGLASILPAGSVLRFVVALPVLFLLPGYAVIAALYPASNEIRLGNMNETASRVAMGFGLSLAVVPAVMFVVGSVGSMGMVQVFGTLTLVTLIIAQLAAARWVQLRKERRYRSQMRATIRRGVGSVRSRGLVGKLTVVLLAVGVIASMGTIAFAMANPPSGNDFTQMYVGTENENGTVSTAAYPDQLDEAEPLVVGVTNEEGETEDYTVVVQLQRVDQSGEVFTREQVGQFERTVPDGNTWQRPHRITTDISGDDLRLKYLLYSGDPPENPRAENAYHHLHLRIDVN
jgi:uncharacterized membrane protein